jgi:outer membrane protein TolC
MVLHAQFAEQVARLRLADEVQATAWQIVGIQTEARQAEVQVATLQQLADDVDRRVRAGDLARADSLIARAEWLAASSALGGIVQKLQAAQARWTLLTGLSTLPELAVVPAPDKDTADLTIHPEWQMAKQSSELARQRLKLLRSSRRDPPEMAVGVRQDMAGRGEAVQGSVVIGVRLPFSTDDRNRPLEAAALSDLEIARVREERLQQRLNSDLALARETQRAIQAQLDADRKGAQLLRERAALIQKSFLAGETPLPELLRVMATAAQAESAVARQTAALGLAGARLQQALGFLP